MKCAILPCGLAAILLVIGGCAAGPNDLAKTGDAEGKVSGFWGGLWHGILSPFTFVVSLFSRDVGVYEVHNNGGWYDFGFLLGASCVFGGGGGGAARSRSRRRRTEAG
jgi:hypothetical protein